MDKIKWCLSQKSGIFLVEPNENLGQEYFSKSENALKAAKLLDSNKEWQISSSYYSMYFSLYALLMKTGIKCEIHSCSIELMHLFGFSDEYIALLRSSLSARIDSQYYTDRDVKESTRNTMIRAAPEFYFDCKEKSTHLNQEKISKIRKTLEGYT